MVRDAKSWLLVAMLGVSAPFVAAQSSDQPWDCEKGLTWASGAATRLKPTEAIAIASEAAKKNGTDLAKYRQSSVCFDVSKDRGRWTVFFDGIEPKPGNHFLVWVRDDNGGAKIMGGE